MERTQSTGWRAVGPVVSHLELRGAEKVALFEAQRLAVKALGLKPGARFVLEQLCGFYRGEQIDGRMLVWPSNDALAERTGLSERTIRYALAELIQNGVIVGKDSANGKRYARRSRQGQIIDAFGFDLTPLLGRVEEFRQRYEALKDLERERRAQHTEITVCRRQVMEMLIATPQSALERAYDLLCAQTPRRSSSAVLSDLLALWRDLLARTAAHHHAACAGNDCRHKDQNNDAPDQSWNKGNERNAGVKSEVEPPDLREACPDVWRYGRPVSTVRDLIGEASEVRGQIGVHQSAWNEACEAVGPAAAATALFLVMQHDMDEQRKGRIIKSPGGYFRFYTRKIQAGEINLIEEIGRFKRKRAH